MTARDCWKWRLGERTEAVVQWRWRVVEDPLVQQAIVCFHSFLRCQDVVWTRCLRCVEYPHQRLFVRRTTLTDKMLYRTVCFALDARERIGGDERVNGRRVDGDIVLSYPYVRVILDFDRSTEERIPFHQTPLAQRWIARHTDAQSTVAYRKNMSNERHDHSRKPDCHLGGELKHSKRSVDEKPAETCDDLACELSCRTV